MAKQVLVYRRDLKMRKGKIAAQCAHAAMAVFFRGGAAARPREVAVRDDPEGPWQRLEADALVVLGMTETAADWLFHRCKKVCLSVEDEDALHTVHRLAKEAGLPCAIVRDAGKTEFGGVPTYTAVAVGPADDAAVDAITGPQGAVATKLA